MSTTQVQKVESHGNGSAEIFFLGGHPLKADLESGLALSGHSESTLNQFLYPNKVTVRECYRSLFIKEKLEYSGQNPKKQRLALAKVDTNEYEKILREEIEYVKPNIIVPLDDIALSVVFPHVKTLHKPRGRKYWVYCYRGSILPLRSDFSLHFDKKIKVIPTLGPQHLYNDWTARSYVGLDFKRIVDNRYNEFPVDEYGFVWVAKTAGDFYQFIKRGIEYCERTNNWRLTSDDETYGGIITCKSFCFDGYEACTIPFNDSSINKAEQAMMWKMAARLMADPRFEKNNQNIIYDWIIDERHGMVVRKVRSDTMLKAGLIYPELPRGLDFLTSIYTPIAYYKDEGKEFNPKIHTRDRLYLYCGKDSLAAHIISNEQDKELEEAGLKDIYENEVAPSILIYRNLNETGLLVDDTQKHKLLDKYSLLYDTNLRVLRSLVNNEDFNPKSPQQVGRLVYEDLKYPLRQKTDEETGAKSYRTDKDTLDDLKIHHAENNKAGKVGYIILNRVIICRKLAKVLEYINTPLYPDNTFRGSYNMAGTETGRTTCSKSIDEVIISEEEYLRDKRKKRIKKLGRSLQTISKHGFEIEEEFFDDFEDKEIAHDLRSMFVPRRGYIFIECDGSQAEDRVVCVLANDFEALADCDRKPKKHAKTAALLFDIDVSLIKKNEHGEWTPSIPKIGITYYDLGKKLRHGGNYDEGAFRIAQITHLPVQFCQEKLNKFHEANPKIRGVYHTEIRKILNSNDRSLRTPLGRRRDFFARLDDKMYKEGFAYIPQSTIGDVTKFTMHRVAADLSGYMTDYFFDVEAHDSILAEVRKDMKDKYIEVFKKHYERKIDFRGCSLSRDFELSIPIEAFIGEGNWMEMEEVKL